MDIKDFTSKDLEVLAVWLKAHKCPEKLLEEVPKVGKVVYGAKEPVAMGFIRQGEGFCLLDGYISNPKASAEERNIGLNLLTHTLNNLAGELGFTRILCFSQNLDIIRRAKAHGFEYLEYSVMGKSLK